MNSKILMGEFPIIDKEMRQFIIEYANKTLWKESTIVKEIENKAELIGPGYEELRRNYDTMKKSNKEDFGTLIGDWEQSSIFEHLMYLTYREGEAKGLTPGQNHELSNVMDKRHKNKVEKLINTLRVINDVMNGEV
ncbi:hypothetical protein JTB14_034110 [Gonioctena quinquepunctata]|nr:hypothetical protein JTB14_034110 [Gonioctena quinquepunctata]